MYYISASCSACSSSQLRIKQLSVEYDKTANGPHFTDVSHTCARYFRTLLAFYNKEDVFKHVIKEIRYSDCVRFVRELNFSFPGKFAQTTIYVYYFYRIFTKHAEIYHEFVRTREIEKRASGECTSPSPVIIFGKNRDLAFAFLYAFNENDKLTHLNSSSVYERRREDISNMHSTPPGRSIITGHGFYLAYLCVCRQFARGPRVTVRPRPRGLLLCSSCPLPPLGKTIPLFQPRADIFGHRAQPHCLDVEDAINEFPALLVVIKEQCLFINVS